ncbi:MAG: thioredoxin [Oscillatoriophycideae cyanobacterium NC_groundwater_1537_Pr4_S-0.65um_50_18]|nr:thioredoxin [Oscillatoriophycideae cyanobacterium NC_groundwater_1537_Pr4_S-0.65um_50_18]
MDKTLTDATRHSASVITLTDDSFQQEVLSSTQPVLVDFWAPWCGPCRLIAPIIESLAADFADRVKVAKLNTDQFDRIATQYQIHAIPTLLIFKDGQIVDEIVGVLPQKELADKLNAVLADRQPVSQVA